MNNQLTFGILAHVDAGKTTLAEAILYQSGIIRKLGRVDHGDTAMDTHALEKERGITIFASQAVFQCGQKTITLLDTPGHVDFSAETERTLQVLDYAVLVISGTDGVQGHTLTLWRLLNIYQVPTFIFVTKMDFARKSPAEIMENLHKELSENCINFSDTDSDQLFELLALQQEDILETFLETGAVSDEATIDLIRSRKVFPVYFGSGLKLEGVDEFLTGIDRYTAVPFYPDVFGAKIFKISHDQQGKRLTHLKVTGAALHVRDTIAYNNIEEKISQIRIYSGAKFIPVESVTAGGICAVTGLSETGGGQGLGHEASGIDPVLEPVMNYRVVLPKGCDPKTMLPKLRILEEEDPQLRITWDSYLQEIHIGLMGEVQIEILKSLIVDRFNVAVEIDSGNVLYKETIADTVEGIGHYEPLRHYAEVHLILSPLPTGSGLIFDTQCSEEILDRNWQRLILTHLAEKQHLGVLTGLPVTDMRITLVNGRSHLKHTEGGDFRQATYRAVRQGLMQAQSRLLEPYYSFKLEIPQAQIGRAINDIRARFGDTKEPENTGAIGILRGIAPVSTLNDYASEVAAYSGGKGRLFLQVCGYGPCHNPEEVIEKYRYDPESDLDNSPDSIFCVHGGGFNVKWHQVPDYMHCERVLTPPERKEIPLKRRNYHISEKEMEAIMLREFGPVKETVLYRPSKTVIYEKVFEKESEPIKYYLVDGYNVIFGWEKLKASASVDLAAARDQLIEILCNYAAFTRCKLVLIFDGYKAPGNPGEKYNYKNISIVYTKEKEPADIYIEKMIQEIGKNMQVHVVTSDGLIQLSALRKGVLRISAKEFESMVTASDRSIAKMISELKYEPAASNRPLADQLKNK